MNTGNGAIPYLPFEIITLILLRLPAQSIFRCKCVCKLWFNFISNPKFAKDHFDFSKRKRKERLFFASKRFCYSFNLECSDSTDTQTKVRAEQNPLQAVRTIWGSCDGLILLYDYSFSLFLANPSTGTYIRLPQPWYVFYSETYGLGYDSSIDDYKIVQISLHGPDVQVGKNIVSVYTLRSNSWKRIESPPRRLELFSCRGAYANGALHWPGESNLVALNIANERFYEVPLPELRGGVEKQYILDIISDCLCVCGYKFGLFHVWVMKQYGVRDSWVKFTVNFSEPLLNWVLPSRRTGKLVLRTRNYMVVLYDPQEGKFEELAMFVPPDSVAIMYEETLIQLRELN